MGRNTISLSGDDASDFEIIDETTLVLRAGTLLSVGDTFNVTVSAVDTSLSGSDAVSTDFVLRIIDNPATELLIREENSELILSSNEVTVLEVLQDIINNDLITNATDISAIEVLGDVVSSSEVEQEAVIKELTPTLYTNIVPAIENTIDDINIVLNSRLSQIGGGAYSVNGPENVFVINSKKRAVWSDFTYSGGDRSSSDGLGFEYDAYTVQLGYEHIYQEIFLGGTLSYSSSTVTNDGTIGSFDINTTQLGIYGNGNIDNYFFRGYFTIAFSSVDVFRRRDFFNSLSSNTDSLSFNLSFNVGQIIKSENSTTTTYFAGLRYTNSSISGINEDGALAMSINSKVHNSLYFTFGGFIDYNFKNYRSNTEHVLFFADYNFNVLDVERDVSSQFVNGGNKFDVAGTENERNTFTIGIKYQYKDVKNNIIYETSYNSRFSSISSTSNFAVKIKYLF